MASPIGIEPTTYRLGGEGIFLLCYRDIYLKFKILISKSRLFFQIFIVFFKDKDNFSRLFCDYLISLKPVLPRKIKVSNTFSFILNNSLGEKSFKFQNQSVFFKTLVFSNKTAIFLKFNFQYKV